MPKIYVLASEEESNIVRDAIFSKKIKQLHTEKPIDTVFRDNQDPYYMLYSYCKVNSIKVVKLSEHESDFTTNCFNDIYQYITKNPEKENLAYISRTPSHVDLERLVKMLQKENFNVEKIDCKEE